MKTYSIDTAKLAEVVKQVSSITETLKVAKLARDTIIAYAIIVAHVTGKRTVRNDVYTALGLASPDTRKKDQTPEQRKAHEDYYTVVSRFDVLGRKAISPDVKIETMTAPDNYVLPETATETERELYGKGLVVDIVATAKHLLNYKAPKIETGNVKNVPDKSGNVNNVPDESGNVENVPVDETTIALETANNRIAELLTEIEKLENALDKARATATTLQGENVALVQRCTGLRYSLETAQRTIIERDNVIAELQRQITWHASAPSTLAETPEPKRERKPKNGKRVVTRTLITS